VWDRPISASCTSTGSSIARGRDDPSAYWNAAGRPESPARARAPSRHLVTGWQSTRYHSLEALFVQLIARRLPVMHRMGIESPSAESTRDHVRTPGPDVPMHTRYAGARTGVAFGHVRSAFDVARQKELRNSVLAQCEVQRVDGGRPVHERFVMPSLRDRRRCVYCSHAGHVAPFFREC